VLDVHIFMDSTFVEIFLMQGRRAITAKMDGTTSFGLSLQSNSGAGITATDVSMFAMQSIWVSQEEVLASAAAAKKARSAIA
jgi:hypothetical protein